MSKKNLTLWRIEHEHEYGTDIFLMRARRDPTEVEAILIFQIDFEPTKGESLTIEEVCNVPTVELP